MKNPAVVTAKAITLQSLGTLSLRNGDNDDARRWGGAPQRNLAGRPVRELQEALITVGTLKGRADGAFGHNTQNAIRRFQWYLNNMDYRLKVSAGAAASTGLTSTFGSVSSGLPGVCDAGLASELASWRDGNYICTTPLVRLSLGGVSNVNTADTFTVLDYPNAQTGEVLVHQDFASVISSTLNDAAKTAKVSLNINQTFRVQGVPPSGAVVPPASKSQHLIGHAVDLNIVDGTTINSSAMFKNETETDNADAFVSAVKKKGIRWGGDFNETDPVHFDDFVKPSGEDYDMIFFFAQHCYDDDHPMRVVS
jgi:peptidoglycan hydrolase-like protein with peptidoglycan-binding domain